MTVSITIGDVGHGNCALLRDGDYCALVDVAPGAIPEALLRDAGISHINDVIISHADDDHLGGLPSLLRQFQVGRVWINGDGRRAGHTWDAARAALREVEESGSTVVRAGVAAGTDITSPSGRLLMKVLAPSGWNALYGTTSAPPDRPRNTANGLSAVVAVFVDGKMEALLPGDADSQAFADLYRISADLRAPLLVFPHHGGGAGLQEVGAFAADLCTAVKPSLVVFSVGRGRQGFPRPAVVASVRSASPEAHVACTQLASQCADALPGIDPTHLHTMPAAGKSTRACCSGTLEIRYGEQGVTHLPLLSQHREFVETAAPSRMCK